MENLTQLFFLALIGSIFALIGGIVFLYFNKWSQVLEANSIPFAAGVLLAVSLLGLLPEAVEIIGTEAFPILLTAFFAAYLFEHFFCGLHHHEAAHHQEFHKSSVPLVILGDTIHNFIDGITIGASFLINPGLGLITAISTFLHEVPHEISDFGILLKAGWKKKEIIFINILSASTTIIGAFLIFFYTGNQRLIGALLAISAGIFLYLGASDFLPQIEQKSNRFKTILPLVIGTLLMVLILAVVPHAD